LSFLLKKVNKILSMSMSCAKFYMKLFLITFIWNLFNHLYPRYCHIFSNSQFNHYKFWTKHCQSYRRSLFQLAQMQNIQNLLENKRNIIVNIFNTLNFWKIIIIWSKKAKLQLNVSQRMRLLEYWNVLETKKNAIPCTGKNCPFWLN
jgi:hypothetical protein